jgi:AraC-like DNA-binding protein
MDKTHDAVLSGRMKEEALNRLDVLQGLLRAALRITSVQLRAFPSKWITADEVIVTHRLLILREGTIDYTVDGRTRRLAAGMQFFVPAWCRREWVVPARAGGCRLLWCEFSSGPVDVPAWLCWRALESPSMEIAAFERMRVLAGGGGHGATLSLEGELKACLARFWVNARTEATVAGVPDPHPEVARAMAWLERHFAEADALERFYRTVALSPNHFRLLFKRTTGETVQTVLARLRLRRARYLVQETSMPMKQIAAETGFADPLYFSLQYRRFWGRPATEDRRTGGVA